MMAPTKATHKRRNVETTPGTTHVSAPEGQWLLLEVIGSDYDGMLRNLPQVFIQHGINDKSQIDCLNTPMTGGLLCKVTVRMPLEVSVTGLQAMLEHLASDLIVDITHDESSERR
jgi:glycine cleavage system regulatory protein